MGGSDDLGRFLRRLRRGGPYVEELGALGKRRRAALEDADAVLHRVRELLPEALDAGLTMTEVAELSAVSRQSLYAMRREQERGSN
jgi:hypothetical protein